MNKKETAAFEALQEELRLAKAMRFTEAVEPDVDIPTNGLSKGFLYSAYAGVGGDRIAPACSSISSHNFGSSEKVSTQQPRRLYSSALLALRALRRSAEQDCAKRLAKIDKQIEAELEAEAYQPINL